MSIIPAIQDTEIKRIVQASLGKTTRPYLKIVKTRKAGYVV
jgi:hypothetical protein